MINLGRVSFHLYGFLIGLGVFVAFEVVKKWGKMEEKILEKMIWGLILFGVVGARLYHVADFWEYYSTNPTEIFYLWNGGLGIWGAIVGGVFFVALFSRFSKLNFLKLLDSIVLGVPIAQSIGRLGNWANGELYGKNGEPLFAWEGGLNLILFGVMIYFSKKSNRLGFLTGVYLLGYGLIRILLENFRPDNAIWRIGETPMAIIFGIIAMGTGITLIVSQKRS